MFSKLVQFYKLITNHNCAYLKANRSQTTSFKFVFFFITDQKPTVPQISCLLHTCCNFQNAQQFIVWTGRKYAAVQFSLFFEGNHLQHSITDNGEVCAMHPGYNTPDIISMGAPGDILKFQMVGKDICPENLPGMRILVVLYILE